MAVAVIAAVVPAIASAQSAQNPMSAGLARGFANVSGFIVKSAEMLPDEKFSYKPVATVRSLAEEFGHVADAHYMFCSRAKGEANPATAKIEGGGLKKADLIAKLSESVAYCAGVYNAMTDATLAEPFQVGQARGIKLLPLANNIAHDNEHYGKIVTALRLNGMVPPSSQP